MHGAQEIFQPKFLSTLIIFSEDYMASVIFFPFLKSESIHTYYVIHTVQWVQLLCTYLLSLEIHKINDRTSCPAFENWYVCVILVFGCF